MKILYINKKQKLKGNDGSVYKKLKEIKQKNKNEYTYTYIFLTSRSG